MNNTLENSLYHSFLRIVLAVTAFVLLFDSGLLFPATADIANIAERHVASVVGISAGVAPNEINQLTTRITELETELEAKERVIAMNITATQNKGSFDTSTFYLSVAVFILLLLITFNYILDYFRSRSGQVLYKTNNV
jgi:TRAP-type C4-dicarboxylate transport system permease small subunit